MNNFDLSCTFVMKTPKQRKRQQQRGAEIEWDVACKLALSSFQIKRAECDRNMSEQSRKKIPAPMCARHYGPKKARRKLSQANGVCLRAEIRIRFYAKN
jgi:hypothetical protein